MRGFLLYIKLKINNISIYSLSKYYKLNVIPKIAVNHKNYRYSNTYYSTNKE